MRSGEGGGWERLSPAVLVAALFVAILPLMLLTTIQLSVSAGDEGVILCGAHRVLHGQVPYRDFFSIITPLSYYLTAAFFKVFGEGLLAARLLQWLVFAATVAVFLRLASRIGIRSPWQVAGLFVLLAFGPPLWYIISHHWIANLALLASAALLNESDECGRPLLLALAGGFAGAALLTLQDQGGYWLLLAAAALLATAGPGRWRRLWLFVGGAALTGGIPLLILAWSASPRELWRNLVLSPLRGYHLAEGNRAPFAAGWDIAWRSLGRDWAQSSVLERAALALSDLSYGLGAILVLGILAVGSLILGWSLLRWRRLEARTRKPVALLAALYLAFLLTALHRPAMLNLVWALPGALLAVLWYLSTHLAADARERLWATVLALPFAVAGIFHCLVVPSVLPSQSYSFARGTVVSYTREDQESLALAERFIEQSFRPGDTVFCYSYAALYYFLLGVDNSTYYDTFNAAMYSKDEVEGLLTSLRTAPPKWVLLDRHAVPGEAVAAWLDQRYLVVGVSPNLAVATRASGALPRYPHEPGVAP